MKVYKVEMGIVGTVGKVGRVGHAGKGQNCCKWLQMTPDGTKIDTKFDTKFPQQFLLCGLGGNNIFPSKGKGPNTALASHVQSG